MKVDDIISTLTHTAAVAAVIYLYSALPAAAAAAAAVINTHLCNLIIVFL